MNFYQLLMYSFLILFFVAALMFIYEKIYIGIALALIAFGIALSLICFMLSDIIKK